MVECANILWKKARQGEFSKDEVAFAGRLLANADIEIVPARPLIHAAIEIALFLDHPAYDCLYLALAEWRDAPFVTADTRLFNKAAPTSRFGRRLLPLLK